MKGSRDGEGRDIEITEAVRTHLANQLERLSSREACFRLRLGENQSMSTTVSAPEARDVLVHHRKRVVLAIESDLAARLQGNTIDLETTPDGRQALIVL